jgi:DNA-directed RNA polymerase specialized sigma24 family protein
MTDQDWEALSAELHRRFPAYEDLVQNALISLLKALRRRKTIPNPKAWCINLIKWRRVDAWRKAETEQKALDDLKVLTVDHELHPGLIDRNDEAPAKPAKARRRQRQIAA